MRLFLGNRKRGMSKGFRVYEHLTQLNLLNIVELIKSVSPRQTRNLLLWKIQNSSKDQSIDKRRKRPPFDNNCNWDLETGTGDFQFAYEITEFYLTREKSPRTKTYAIRVQIFVQA